MSISHAAMVELIVGTLEAVDGAGSDLRTGWRSGEWLEVHGNLDVHHLASDVLEATKPRVVTTVEELATLPLESVVIDTARCVAELESVGADCGRTLWFLTGCEEEISGQNLNLPVTVLYTPEADQ